MKEEMRYKLKTFTRMIIASLTRKEGNRNTYMEERRRKDEKNYL